jgi:broad specificity phosphatase PhoE
MALQKPAERKRTRKLTVLTFLRHGARPPTPPGAPRYPGGSLNAQGRAEARRAEKILRNYQFDVILVSDLARTKETAAIVCASQKTRIQYCEELREYNKIVFENVPADPEVKKKYAREVRSAKRAAAFLKSVLKMHVGKKILIIGSGNNMRGSISYLFGIDPRHAPYLEFDTCSITSMSVIDGKPGILHMNYKPGNNAKLLHRVFEYEE